MIGDVSDHERVSDVSLWSDHPHQLRMMPQRLRQRRDASFFISMCGEDKKYCFV